MMPLPPPLTTQSTETSLFPPQLLAKGEREKIRIFLRAPNHKYRINNLKAAKEGETGQALEAGASREELKLGKVKEGKGLPLCGAGKAVAVLDAHLSRQLAVPAYPWDWGRWIGFCTQTGHAQPCPSAPSTGPIHIAEGSWGRPPPGSAANPQPPG